MDNSTALVALHTPDPHVTAHIPLSFVWMDKLTPPAEPMFLVQDLVPRNGLTFFYGPPGCGKSFLMLHLSACVALGREWFGRRVEQGAVLLLALEGGSGVRLRLFGAKCYDRELENAPIALVDELFEFRGPQNKLASLFATIGQINSDLSQHGPSLRLIIVDTFARALGTADENSSMDMGEMLNVLDALGQISGAAIVVVGHTGKHQASGLRGHSSALGACDSAWEVKGGVTEKRKVVECAKSKDGPSDLTFAFELEEISITGMEDRRTCRVRELEKASRKNPAQSHPVDVLIAKELRAMKDKDGDEKVPGPRMRRRDLCSQLAKHRPVSSSGLNWTKQVTRRCKALTDRGIVGSEKAAGGDVLIWLEREPLELLGGSTRE